MDIVVIGGGAWGIALTRLLANAGHTVTLGVRDNSAAEAINVARENKRLLPGVLLPPCVTVTAQPETKVDMVAYAVPSQAMRSVVLRYMFPSKTIRVSLAKGLEHETLLSMSEVIRELAPDAPVAVLSGPSHAEEVGRDLPACVVAASCDGATRATVQEVFNTPTFRVYTSGDVTGVEMGGALKNIMAIAAGACEGFGLGDNAKASLITRGLAEMIRLGSACGASLETFAGLAGLGDLVVTCSSRHSRNHHVGQCISRGESLEDIARATPKTAEGIHTTRSAMALAHRHRVDMPITCAVHQVLFEQHDPRACITALMTRLMKAEWA